MMTPYWKFDWLSWLSGVMGSLAGVLLYTAVMP